MFTQFARKILYLVLIVSLLANCAGGPSITSATGQTGFATQFTYDPNGNIKTRTDANGNTTEYVYDAANRLTTIRYQDRSSVKFTYDSLGQRTRMTDSLGTTSYEYDIHGRLVKITDPNGNVLQYAYDPRSMLTKLVYPDGSAAVYTWDANGQLATVQDVSGTTSYEYDLGGRLTGRTLPNSINTHYEYDNANRLIAIQHIASSGTLLLGYKYELDATGNRTQVTQVGPDGTQVTRYEYDSLNRLVKVTYPDGETVSYTYDASGNRTSMDSSKKGKTSYSYNGLGQLTQLDGPDGKVTFRYDANGNLVERADKKSHLTTRYTWDYENRLVGVDDGTRKVSYEYDGNGNRIGKIVNGKSTEYVNNINGFISQILSEINSDGETRNYSYGMERIGQIDPGGLESFYLTNGLGGSVSNLIDSNGRITDSYTYDAFGNTTVQLGESGNPFAYDGEYADCETGLIFLRNRYYDPAIGRFLSRDVRMGSQVDPQSLNHYVFARNNPVNFVDPSGMEPVTLLLYSGIILWYMGLRLAPYWPNIYSFAYQFLPGVPSAIEGTWGFWGWVAGDIVFGGGEGLRTLGEGLGAIGNLGSSVWDWYNEVFNVEYAWSYYTQPFLTEWSGTSSSGESTSDLLLQLYYDNDTWDDDQNRYFFPPMCPPFCGDDDGDGGGGAAVGGVSLDRAAEVLVNLNDITGASYDPRTGQVMLIGRQDLSLPPMNMDDLVVAIRAIYGSGENPGVTMVPVDPSMQDITQRVEYFGQTQDTHFGMVMFEADRYLKSLASGTDTLTGQPVTPNVPGFKSELDLAFETHIGDVPWHRNWFVPGEIVLTQSEDGHSMIFNEATIILQSRFIEFLPDGSLEDVTGSSPVTDRFTQFMTEHYDEFAAEKPELAELVQLAKIVGFVRWLHDNNIPVDLSWVNDYQVAYVDTPDTTPGIVAERSDGSYTVISMGGVDFSTDNTYTGEDAADTDALAVQASTSLPADFPLSWNFDYNGETLTAVAFNVAPAEILGGYATTVTDLAVPVSGGQTVSFTRQYNSLDLGTGPLGSGWSQIIPSLTFQTVPVPDSPNSYYTQAVMTLGTRRVTFNYSEDGFFYPDDTTRSDYEILGLTGDDPFTPLSLPEGYQLQPGLPGQPLEIQDAQGRTLAYTGFALLDRDGSGLAFDQRGRVIGQRDAAGQVLSYTYKGNQLTTIADATGHNLQFAYYTNGYLTELTAYNGQAIHYNYDSSGNLTAVSDENSVQQVSYAYNADGRLNRITNRYGQAMEIAYDGLGRVVSSNSPSDSWTAQFNNQTNTVTLTNSNGNVITRQYNDQNRLLSETDPFGNTVQYQYNLNNHLTAYTDRNGNTTTFDYDERGLLTEAVSPLGDRTILWNYNEFGLPEGSIDPVNGITFYEYDERGRLTGVKSGFQVTDMSSDGEISYLPIDPLSITYVYDAAGNLTTVQDAAGSATRFAFDNLGNLTTVRLPGGGEIRQTFDERSRLTSVADATGYQVDFGYDGLGQLASITTPAGQTQYQYTNGLVTAVTDPLNNTIQYGYDAAGRLTSVTEPGGSVTTYEYDAFGNLVTVLNALGGQVRFQYDAVGRVVGITYGDGDDSITGTPTPTTLSTPPVYFWVAGGLALVGVLIGLAFFLRRQRCPMCGARAARKAEYCPKCGMTLYSV